MFTLLWLLPAAAVYGQMTQQPMAAGALTIERIAEEREWNHGMPESVAWSPDRKSVSFIRSEPVARKFVRGVADYPLPATSIWSMSTEDGKERQLVSNAEIKTAFTGEHFHAKLGEEEETTAKRMKLLTYLWSPSGRALLIASSTSLAWFDLETHKSHSFMANGKERNSLQMSPDGRFVSFVQDHALWLADAVSGSARAFTQAAKDDFLEGEPDWTYRHEFRLPAAYWWSPDSSSIAWLETDDRAVDKYALHKSDGEDISIAYPRPGKAIPKIRLFVRAISGGKTIAIDLGSDPNVYIPKVQWLPDGKHLAIERLSRSQKTLDLLVADTATGKSHTILTEQDMYWINFNDELHFLADSHRFLWASERSGYRHLYLFDLSGHQLAQLTHGDWEVTSLAGVDEVAGAAYFMATEASPVERQLYRVNLDGSGFARITQEKGTHSVLFSSATKVFVDTWSDRATPPRPYLLRVDGSRIGGAVDKTPQDAVASQLVSTEFFTFKSHIGTELNAWMMKPPNFDPQTRYPVIFYAAGGPDEQIVRNLWGGDISLWFNLMAQKGYIIFALDNRGTAGRGHLFEEPIHLRFSGAEMADLRDGILYLHSQSWVDKTRVGIWGCGYGGFLALHAMMDRPLLFKAGFAGSPISDWHLYDAVFGERYLEDPDRNQDGWISSSPVENAGNLNAPLLLAQATLDEQVHLENSLMLQDELLDKGKYADILLFADRKNLVEDRGTRAILFGKLTDFFVKNL
jgi:dipeptidyl-peptidase-4